MYRSRFTRHRATATNHAYRSRLTQHRAVSTATSLDFQKHRATFTSQLRGVVSTFKMSSNRCLLLPVCLDFQGIEQSLHCANILSAFLDFQSIEQTSQQKSGSEHGKPSVVSIFKTSSSVVFQSSRLLKHRAALDMVST